MLPIEAMRRAAEARFMDRCRITEDPQGTADDVLDPVTLELVSPPRTVVYEGPCIVTATVRVQEREIDRGGAVLVRQRYSSRIPATAPTPEPGALLEVLSSVNDAALVGRVFRVVDVSHSSLLVTRELRLSADVEAPPD